MRLSRLFIAAVMSAGLHSAPAAAQQAADATSVSCLAPDHSNSGRLDWFLGLHPTDDLLSTWCRLQAIPGNLRFNVLFPTSEVHHSWETSFDGRSLPASKIVELVQSLLPVSDGPARDANGMEFPKVLRNVVQLAADKAPDGTNLGFAPQHPAARELALWEPMVIRIRPVALAGQEFTLSLGLRPNLGLLALGLEGRATDVRMQGWKGRMTLAGGLFGGKCSSAIPFCEGIPEAPVFHTPWILDEVRLEATGDNMTAAASTIMNTLANSSRNARFVKEGTPPSFNTASGQGNLQITDGISTMTMSARGSAGGTKSISIVWTEGKGDFTYRKALQKAADDYRSGADDSETAPAVPDSLGRL